MSKNDAKWMIVSVEILENQMVNFCTNQNPQKTAAKYDPYILKGFVFYLEGSDSTLQK